MDFYDIFTGVLFANLVTVMFVGGIIQIYREDKEGNGHSWVSLGCAAFPLILLVLGLLSVGHYQP